MKRSFSALWGRRLRYGVYALLALAGLLALAWVVFYEFFFRPAIFRAMLEEMTDVRLERIPLEEARRRAPFPICLPTWLPEGLEGPEISFHSEWGAPWVADVTLTYRKQGQVVLQIFQAHRPVNERRIELTPSLQDLQNVKYALLKWQVGHDEAKRLVNQAEIRFQEIEKDGFRYEVYEMFNPPEHRAIWMTWWGLQQLPPPHKGSPPYSVHYALQIRFFVDEAIKVAEGLSNCLAPLPTSVPSSK
jgi:hypothetical protein